MTLHSFRSRLLLGSILWTAGLLGFVHLLSMTILRAFPILMKTPHHVLAIVGTVLAISGLLLVRDGFKELDRLRTKLGAVRDGHAQRVEGPHMSEVAPLVEDLNALLEHREHAVQRALSTAGDLAHGLKTPLAVLEQEAAYARETGQHELAATIVQQVDRMRRQVDVHLAQARAAGAGATTGARAAVRLAAERLVRTMQRLHAERVLAISIDVPESLVVRCESEDLEEMLGNLLDNACKWAETAIVIRARVFEGRAIIEVEDDGPGLDTPMRERVLQRGVRADEAAPGSGLGLAIVSDLAALYGGSIALESAPKRGLRARLALPCSGG